MEAAIVAAAAAFSPAPVPSVGSTSPSFRLHRTRWRSPDSPWPGSASFATPYSTIGSFIVSIFSPPQLSPRRVGRGFQIRPLSAVLPVAQAPDFRKWRSRHAMLDEYHPSLDHH